MKEFTSVFQLEAALKEEPTFALIFYAEKHEKSAAMLKVFEKLAGTISECAKWAICSVNSIAASRAALKIKELPTVWFCRDGCISRIVNLPQAQLYVKEARDVFVNCNVTTPTFDANATKALLEDGCKAAIDEATGWLAERPLVVLSENQIDAIPSVVWLDPTVETERAQALLKKFNIDLDTDVLIVDGATVEKIPRGDQIPTHVRELIDNSKSKAESVLDARCYSIVQSAPLMIVMKGTRAAPYCKFTKRLLAILGEADIDQWAYFDIFTDDAVRERLKVLFNWPTYPQIYVYGKLIGGLDTVKSIVEEGGNEGLRKVLLATE